MKKTIVALLVFAFILAVVAVPSFACLCTEIVVSLQRVQVPLTQHTGGGFRWLFHIELQKRMVCSLRFVLCSGSF